MSCIVCGNDLLLKLSNIADQPLAALNLPKTADAAHEALRFPMDFHLCAFCGHVFNTAFNYAPIPYAEDSNLMFNSGALWQGHMQILVDKLVKNKHIWGDAPAIDIGCGDGQFFSKLKQSMPEAICFGYEPGIDADKIQDFPVIRDFFIPQRDLRLHRPKLLVCRHVVEHLDKPRVLLSEIAYWCGVYELAPIVVIEVPCFDNSLIMGRMTDFLYEHVSNFTSTSFKTLFTLCGYSELEVNRYYGNEVLAGFFVPNKSPYSTYNEVAQNFCNQANTSQATISLQLERHSKEGQIIFWGGTGKGAAFLNMYGIHSSKYPFVVDSDANKVGRFVPGMGQEIRKPEEFIGRDNLSIVVTTPWRAYDIMLDIERRGIAYKKLLVLKEGELCEYPS
jgi:hypothetical protein